MKFPTEESLREFLLDSAEQYCKATGMKRSEIGQRALNDPAFLSQVETGRHIEVRTFETFMRWLDARWSPDPHSLRDLQLA